MFCVYPKSKRTKQICQKKCTYFLIWESFGAIYHSQMSILIDGIKWVGFLLLVNRLHLLFFLLFILLLVMGINPCDKEAISIILDVPNVWSWRLLWDSVFLKHIKISYFHLKILIIVSGISFLTSNVVIHFLYKLYS